MFVSNFCAKISVYLLLIQVNSFNTMYRSPRKLLYNVHIMRHHIQINIYQIKHTQRQVVSELSESQRNCKNNVSMMSSLAKKKKKKHKQKQNFAFLNSLTSLGHPNIIGVLCFAYGSTEVVIKDPNIPYCIGALCHNRS